MDPAFFVTMHTKNEHNNNNNTSNLVYNTYCT